MRTIHADAITEAVARLCEEANYILPRDVKDAIRAARAAEDWPVAQGVLDCILENQNIAEGGRIPICQDTGAACVFLELGQDVHIAGGDLARAVDEGVRRGYTQLRKSMVADPLRRVNTGDNTPAMLHVDIVPGDGLRVTVAPKGFGSENMSRLKMLRPSDGIEGVKAFVVETVREAGPNACPPVIAGVGIGGTFDKAALIAKKALLRPLDQPHMDPFYRALEEELLELINATGVGPQGFGGRTTALRVLVETLPTHIAGLPVAVNINCHVARHATEAL